MDLKNIGFYLYNDFVNEKEEKFLFEKIKTSSTSFNKSSNRNSIKRYGSATPYRNGIVSTSIPEYFNFILERLIKNKYVSEIPKSISVNEYLIGQEIKAHIDNEKSGNVITILSLVNNATMILQKEKKVHSILLPARSLMQMKDESRYEWTHAILPVHDTRYSIVFRC